MMDIVGDGTVTARGPETRHNTSHVTAVTRAHVVTWRGQLVSNIINTIVKIFRYSDHDYVL